MVATNSLTFLNISITLLVNVSNGSAAAASVGVYQGADNVTMSILTTTGISLTIHAATVRYSPNSSYNGTLLVFGGTNGDVLQFYCCLDAEYSDSLVLEDTTGVSLTTSMTAISASDTPSLSRLQAVSGSSAPTRSSSRSRWTGTRSDSRSSSRSARRSRWTGSNRGSGRLSPSQLSATCTDSSRSEMIYTSSRLTASRSRGGWHHRKGSSSLTMSTSGWPVALGPLQQEDEWKVAAGTASTSTSTTISSLAFVATTPVMTLQRMNSILAIVSCRRVDATVLPSRL